MLKILNFLSYSSKKFSLSLVLFTIVFPLLQAQSDPLATCQTQSLYQQLKNLSSDHLLFGHQNSTFEGIGWEDTNGFKDQSDCLEAVGDYPAIYGFDFVRGFIFQRHVIRAHERGGIITFSDHMNNFKTRGNAWNTQEGSVSEILDESSGAHNQFIIHLNRTASFFNSLVDKNGQFIPVIYRPFHENSGDWFWWGEPYCTPEEYRALWQFSVNYLRNIRNVHHVLFAYSPSDPAFRGGYGDRYPGDEYVDIIGFDSYASIAYEMFLVPSAQLAVEFAAEHGKVAALTEFGVNGGIQFANNTDWFTNTFLAPIKGDSLARQLAYALTWRNDRSSHHWVPLPGSPNHNDFLDFHEDKFTLFENDLPTIYDCSLITATTASSPKDKMVLPLKVTPNPASTYIQVQIPEMMHYKKCHLSIYDSNGRLVKQMERYMTRYQINIHDLSDGVYFLKLVNNEGVNVYNATFVKS